MLLGWGIGLIAPVPGYCLPFTFQHFGVDIKGIIMVLFLNTSVCEVNIYILKTRTKRIFSFLNSKTAIWPNKFPKMFERHM